MTPSFEDQVVVVTGASSGVGRACARAFGERGAKVVLIARNEEALNVAADEIRRAGGSAMIVPVDVADAEAVDRAIDRIVDDWGRIDILINSAMVTVFSRFTEMTSEEFRRVTDVTYHGYVYTTRSALRHMQERGSGRIIQIGSALAYRSIPLQSAYCGAKAAIRGFTDSLRTELLADGSEIKLSQLHLPAVNTPQPVRQRNKTGWLSQPVPPMFTPDSMADTAVWAAEHMPREMLIGWPVVRAVWGEKLFPDLADWYLAKNGINDQLTDEPVDPDRPDILFEPVPGDPGANGPFTETARGMDWQMYLRMNARPVMAVAALAAVGMLALLRRG
jgi:NADP-dependent 3-hydroxy acid dehydrogenase YdfG